MYPDRGGYRHIGTCTHYVNKLSAGCFCRSEFDWVKLDGWRISKLYGVWWLTI